ncbi:MULTISPECIES: ProQ/FINO family protein [Giesbergeria]|uniref:ProQ/FINO family protein n=1 Tax=Giesbergeria sinuosa TaxID=80883 RepID=A0ABV9QDH9_9BURK
MTDSVPAASTSSSPVAPAPAAEVAAATAQPVEAAAGNAQAAAPRRPRTRRGKRGTTDRNPTATTAPAATPSGATESTRRAPRPVPPTLQKLAELYPQLFGAVFRPLKRGIFQDMVAAHPDLFEREALKQALGLHTRSTRYLQSVATGQPRHDLQGQPVEAMAPEHIHYALLEVYRRRQGQNHPELTAKLCARIVANIETSGLSREDYAERVRTRDDAANALLDQALNDLSAKMAREEALLRTFEASGQKTVQAFADMYGMDINTVVRSLHSARSRAAKTAASDTAAE